jgi:O-antigen/teichoic acid export membrane protein
MVREKKKSIKFNAILNSVRTILNLLFPLITFPYVSRVLTVDELGKYNFSSSIISYFLLLAALGIDKYAVREGTKYRDDRGKIGQFASEIFTINIVSTLVSYGFLFLYLLFSQKAQNYITCIIILSFQIVFTTIGTEWLYVIYEEYTYITIRSILFKIISMAMLFVFVRQPGDYLKYAAITVLASVGSNILNFIHGKKICDLHITFKFEWMKKLVPILIIFASNVAIQIYVSSDTTMLGYLANDYVVGIYGVSTKIYNAIIPVLAAALTVTIPRFSFYVGRHMKEEYDSLMLKVSNTLFVIIFPTIVGLIMLSRNIVLIIGGSKYEPSKASLTILSVAIFFSIFSMLFNQCALIPYKREKYSLFSSVFSACENFGLNFLLIPLLAERGAAITTVLAELTMASMNFYNSRDIVGGVFRNKMTKKNILTIIIGCVSIVVVCMLSCMYISNMIIQTLIAVAGSMIAYFGILLGTKNPIAKELFGKIKIKMRN